MRYFYDCEFIEDGRSIDLISVGVVSQDGREYYAICAEFDESRAGEFVRKQVLPQLPSPSDKAWRSRERIREDLWDFVRQGAEPFEMWAWMGAYDHVAVCGLWGAMPALPNPWPRFTREVRQEWERVGKPELPPRPSDAHHALADAHWARQVYELSTGGQV